MTLIQAIILGLIQGFTEFLPVSSSGHLVIAQTLLGISTPPLVFDILVHVGTLIAVLVYFRHRLLKLTPQLILYTLIATLPAVVAGVFLEPYLTALFSSLAVAALGLLITSLLLYSTRFLKPSSNSSPLTPLKAFVIGLFQALAITPGISRSGSTVVTSLYLGLSKSDAFFFSFLLSIPAILGAQVLALKDLTDFTLLFTLPNFIGFLVAAVSGLFALKLLRLLISSSKLHYFAYYCLTLSLLLFTYLFSR